MIQKIREITAAIASLRAVDWESFSINFVFVLNPGVLDAAPHSWIATTHADDDAAADAVERAITSQFSNVSAVSVKEAVATAQKVIALLGGALRFTAKVTLMAGGAGLAGAVAGSAPAARTRRAARATAPRAGCRRRPRWRARSPRRRRAPRRADAACRRATCRRS